MTCRPDKRSAIRQSMPDGGVYVLLGLQLSSPIKKAAFAACEIAFGYFVLFSRLPTCGKPVVDDVASRPDCA
ncbi:hypothetical protein AH332_17870 [Salmonella enterica subsp. salamae]|nr:hypothetical protein [Salmonella enterica subsp. salamae]